MTQANLSMKQKTDSQIQNRLVVAMRVGAGEAWIGSSGLADANYCI